jgi:transglutaminase-like putative cysteine protease
MEGVPAFMRFAFFLFIALLCVPVQGSCARVSYQVTHRYTLKALDDLYTLQLKFPVVRKDFPGQTIRNFTISPSPSATVKDPSGNEIAVFYFSNVKSGGVKIVQMQYVVDKELPEAVDPGSVPDEYDGSIAAMSQFLGKEGDVDPDQPKIREAAREICGTRTNPYQKAKALYDFIAGRFTYRNDEDGGSGLQHPWETLTMRQGNCADITKLFLALCRASGIPCRQVDGTVFEAPKGERVFTVDCGHAWVEVYLPAVGWREIDPTFALTAPVRDEYFCFIPSRHIKEYHGQLVARSLGTLYKGSTIEVRTMTQHRKAPVSRGLSIEIRRIDVPVPLP